MFNKVSGTTGLTGSADATFVLEQENRASNAAKLYVTGREGWTGTATELLDALGETGTAANVLTKWMNEYRLDFLLENHIRYDFSRRSSGRMISLARQEDVEDGGHDRHAPKTESDSYPPKERKMNYALSCVSRNAKQAALRLANATTSGRKKPIRVTQILIWNAPKITTIL